MAKSPWMVCGFVAKKGGMRKATWGLHPKCMCSVGMLASIWASGRSLCAGSEQFLRREQILKCAKWNCI